MITPAPRGGWIRRLWPFLAAHRKNVLIAFGFAVAGQVVSALTPLVERNIVDNVVVHQRDALAPWLTVLIAAGVFGFGAAYVRRYVGGRVSLDVQYDLRNAIYERLQRLDFARHDDLATGQLVSRASSDVGLIQQLLAFLPIAAGNLIFLVVALVAMLYQSAPLTLVVAGAIPVMFFVATRLREVVFPASWDAQQRAGEVAGVVDEAVTGVRVVKAYGQEERELDRLSGVARRLFGSRVRMIRLQARFAPALQALPTVAQAAVLGFGGWLAIHHEITLGTFLAFTAYMIQLTAPVRMLAGVLAVAPQARAGAERILDLLDSNPLVVERPDAVELPPSRGEIVFDDVTFGYLRDEPVLRGLNLRVAPGETVALVGTSGSGKSTVSLLVPRFYDVQGGRVAVDGYDVRDVTLDSLRRQIGVVFEDSFLFSDTVRDNIAYGRPDAGAAAVEAAARAAEAHDFIAALPEGYETVVGERGLTLSGGQRQRVALARALLTDPRILILDDATSSIDSSTEEDIHRTLKKVMAGRTTVLVAHRRSTLRLADRIVVVDDGRVADEGSHEALLESSPLYRALLGSPDGESCEGPEVLEGITADAWPDVAPDPSVAVADTGAIARVGPGGGGGLFRGGGGAASVLSATPKLMADLRRLDERSPADADPMVDEDRARHDRHRFSLASVLRPYRRALGIGLGLVVSDSLLTLAGPLLVKEGIDRGVARGAEHVVWIAAAVFLALNLVDWGVTWAYTRYTGRTAERVLFDMRLRIFAHLQRLGLDFYDREMAGRVMTRMTTDVEALSQLLQTGLINAIVSLITCGGVLILLVVINPRLTAVAAAVLPFLVVGTLWYRQRSSRAYERARDRIAAVNANFQESLSGVRVAQAYVREGRNIDDFRDVAASYLDARLEAQRLIAIYFPFVLFLSDVAAALVLGAGAVLVHDHLATSGTVIAFILWLDQFFSPIQQLSQVFDTWQQATASLDKIRELMGTPSSTPSPAEPVALARLRGAIAFEDVHFSYPGGVTEALAGVDFEITPGETVALVGETGAGKSTVVKLVARFYDPTHGRVLVDGVPVSDFDLAAYRRQLGVVPQEPFLFSGSIRDNIAYGRPDADDAAVEAAARAVGAHDLIASLPGGYRHNVSERGRSLSAGQRQLISLARAHLVDPAILLLDEATSNLDLGTEARVQLAMGVLASGRTTILVAHRLPTARGADRIFVLDGGRLVEQGTHDHLIALGGTYHRLWAAFTGESADAATGEAVA
jgi:ATP-binding cassette subfamily B protein